IKNNWRTRQITSVSKLCTCWAIEAKVIKLAFSLSMTTNSYQELQKLLERECEILLE
ncbi:4841_t:CDS:1, partial [Gigaspora rosea]